MPSFDVVSEADMPEVTNAVDQAKREIGTRYDFRDAKSSIELEGKEIILLAEDDMKSAALQDVLRQKLAKRGISLKLVTFSKPSRVGGDMIRVDVTVKESLTDIEMKEIVKEIKKSKIKVQAQIQGEQIRVSGKKRDDLQAAIAAIKSRFQDLELQFINFRD